MSSMATPREHIEEIRRSKFSIGAKELNPLTEDLHQAVKNLSAELYAKDVHFLMELIQNAEDNEYEEGVDPSLQFVITSEDITGTEATSTLLIFNNEKGFSPKNIESICSVGRSTKKNKRQRGYIGEKGIGFKSVFLITSQPHIFSNGYQIRFNESPCSECNVGYIVPEWVEENPILFNIKRLYGSSSKLPTTTIVLPLKHDKVKPVKQQLSSIHPELLLFLSKIKNLLVKEDPADEGSNTVSAISISAETNFVTRKNIDAVSYTLNLSADEKSNGLERECSYYMWRQKFPVKPENKVDRRMEVDEWVITLAFPNGERIHRGKDSPGIYAFLPTEMVTNFPFIIQADFLLASSRETILLDSKWNQGILNCVPIAFVNAFSSLVKASEDAPVSVLPSMFGFLPVLSSSYPLLESVRLSIQAKLMEESIIPCESYTEQKFYNKPRDVVRLMPGFWNMLKMAREQGVIVNNISSHGKFVLASAFDDNKYDHLLNFLSIKYVDYEWYSKCIKSSNLVLGVSEDLYLVLLLFIAENWTFFSNTGMVDIPLLKYVDGQVSSCSVRQVLSGHKILLPDNFVQGSWLIDWNKEFRCADYLFFLPKSTQDVMFGHSKRQHLWDWLFKKVKVTRVTVNDYAVLLCKLLGNDRKGVVTYAHFLFHSLEMSFLSSSEVDSICRYSLRLVDNYGLVKQSRTKVLVPANGSSWMQLFGTNPWGNYDGYVELSEDYLYTANHAGVLTSEKELLGFLKSHVTASDIPDLPPPDAQIPSCFSLLTKQNAYVLLNWIGSLKRRGIVMPQRFMDSIKEGSWLRVSLCGSGCCKPPSQSFFLDSSWECIVQNGSVFVDIPLIDQEFYGKEICNYKDELGTVGVILEFGEACNYIGNHLMTLAASSTPGRDKVYSILNFIKFLRKNFLPSDNFVNRIKGERWLRTSQGVRSPVGSAFYDEQWKAASRISDIPFIDCVYYGNEIVAFKTELELLGVIFSFSENFKLVVDNLKTTSSCFMSLPADSTILLLKCLSWCLSSELPLNRWSFPRLSDNLLSLLKDKVRLKTNLGYICPAECYLFDPTWGFFLQVFDSFPFLDVNFYGEEIFLYKNELRRFAVVVDFEEATIAFGRVFRQKASVSSLSKDTVLSFLSCYKKLKAKGYTIPSDLRMCIEEVRWLRTRLTDFRAPKDCILYSLHWDSISSISLLPFIDDSDNYYGMDIHEYKEELQSMGVAVSFSSGAKFVASSLFLPHDPVNITPAAVYSLLDCIRIFQREYNQALIATISEKAARPWIKTHSGYQSAHECLLFSSDWDSNLQKEDGPFIDESFYGAGISCYSKELNALGVVVEKRNGCSLLASYLDSHKSFPAIERIYMYLNELNWKPASKRDEKIWIPNGSDDGKWVNSEECVLHDKDGLFGGQLYVLDNYYEKKLLCFFSNSLQVKARASLDDYCKLWKDWEDSSKLLSPEECIAFWEFVSNNWSLETQEVLSEKLLKLPVSCDVGKILLSSKNDVFIADDLLLKDLFEQSSSKPLFIWYPQPDLLCLPRIKLLGIFSKVGAKNLSLSVQKIEPCKFDTVVPKKLTPEEVFIGRGLFKLILGFLAHLHIPAAKRHEALKGLLEITVMEAEKPITVDYSLPLSSGEIVNVKARRLILWEREKSLFYMHKMDRSSGHKNFLECATYFADVVSEGLMWDKEELIPQLAELIRLGFMVEFDEEAVGFLMNAKNLQIFLEDENFLSSAFSA